MFSRLESKLITQGPKLSLRNDPKYYVNINLKPFLYFSITLYIYLITKILTIINNWDKGMGVSVIINITIELQLKNFKKQYTYKRVSLIKDDTESEVAKILL